MKTCFFHRWKLITSTPIHKYYECRKCGHRRTEVLSGQGYEPIKEGFPNPYYMGVDFGKVGGDFMPAERGENIMIDIDGVRAIEAENYCGDTMVCLEEDVREIEYRLQMAETILQSWQDGENPWKETSIYLANYKTFE